VSISRRAFGLGLGLILVPACSSTHIVKAIGPEGGTIALADGTGVAVGAGALPASTNVTVTVDDGAPAPSTATLVGQAYRFGPEGQTFSAPVTVTIAVDLGKLPPGKSIADVIVYTAPVSAPAYVALETTVGDGGHVRATTTHFSYLLPVVAQGVPPCADGTRFVGGVCVSSDMSVAADMAVSASPDMASVSPDMAVSASPDMAVSASPDMAVSASPDFSMPAAEMGTCSFSATGGGGTCTLTTSCNSHTYELACQNTLCACSTDGLQTAQQFQAATCTSGWSACGYPGTPAGPTS
jgi:hypothetical protein